MQKDQSDLLEVLKSELDFMQKGGYGRASRESWRPAFIFEDSPTCMNYDRKKDPGPCRDCALMQLVPPELRFGEAPCRQIPLNIAGETLDSVYRWGDQHDIEETLRNWLVHNIAKLEERQKAPRTIDVKVVPTKAQVTKVLALHQDLHPKCANPACPAAFHWIEGGKFFRFRPDKSVLNSSPDVSSSVNHVYDVKHFWLCERCSHVFTLVYDEEHGVVLTLRWLKLPFTEAGKELSGAKRN
jgi:hypothetical protein